MNLQFSPNNNVASKRLFTGRKHDLENIFQLIEAGNCVALYGERKCGKTLTMLMIKDIINGNTNIETIVDQTLYKALNEWKDRFTYFKAIYLSLEATRNEESLVEKFIEEINQTPVLLNILNSTENITYSSSKKLGILLRTIQANLEQTQQKLIILLDEMEILEEYENRLEANTIAELFCDRYRFPIIFFIHVGSHQWLERVSKPGSIFTHLEPYYLRSIDENDLINFLLTPLGDLFIKKLVAKMSGSKPLYAQHIAKTIVTKHLLFSEQDNVLLLQDELLNNISIKTHINQNIYEEKRLDEVSKKLLTALAHKSNSTKKELSVLLNLSEILVSNKLDILVNFGTISKQDEKYKIVGELIETYGKIVSNDPWTRNHELNEDQRKEGNNPMSTNQTQQILRHMEISDKPTRSLTYILGCFEKRVTIYSQQVRALNLIYSLFSEGYIKEDSKVCIIGAGVAGLTAAVAATYKGCKVTLLEKAPKPLTIFRYNSIRYVHPHIYDWPKEGSEDPNANLPLMNWTANSTNNVVDQLLEQWSRFEDKLKFIPQVQDIKIKLDFRPTVSFNDSNGVFDRDIFDVLIMAVGFGEETSDIYSRTSYWSNDRYHEMSTDSTTKHYLIVGCGDGGLTDLLRVKLEHFRHENIIKDFFSTTNNQLLSKLTKALIEIEKQAEKEEDPSEYLFEKYRQLDVPKTIDDCIKPRIRKDTKVTLNGQTTSFLTLNSSILNRFLVSRLSRLGLRYIQGSFSDIKDEGKKKVVSIEGKTPESFDEVIVRTGPKSAIETFSEIFSRCRDLTSYKKFDQTRDPINWLDNGFFSSASIFPNPQ